MLLSLSTVTLAQNFRLGFQASPHYTWMSSSKGNINNSEAKLGVKYGLEADIYLAGYPRYSLNTGLFISNHSFIGDYNLDEPFFINEITFNERVDIRYKLNYVEIPVIIKLRSDQFYRMTFYGQFGLSNMINISASAESSDAQFSGDDINNGFNNNTIRPYNLCMVMGGGVEYDVGGNTALNFGIQYSNGLTDATNIKGLNEKTIFNSLRIVIGVLF